jgi:microsomal dipeptidase-like Zn-dependent dipeptidase
MRRVGLAVLAALAIAAPAHAAAVKQTDLANGCFQVGSAGPFYLKPTGLGTYLLYDSAGTTPGEWAIRPATGGRFNVQSTADGHALPGSPVTMQRATGCTPFPEAQVGASGTPRRSVNRDGSVFGFVDAHLHITADMRGGGKVIYGEAFDRFGIPAALGQDASDHGPDGSLDITGNLLRTGLPFGTHDTHGWPTFAGWPTFDTQTHQQTYYVWLERAFEAGLRLVVAQTVDDQPMCEIEPRKNPGGCDETRSIKAQIRRLRAMEDYIDAQSGGRGRGWFRLVYSPGQARRAIARGKLAVLIGIESSDLFGCSLRNGRPQCTRRDIDRGLAAYKRLGVRTMFVAHWINNALAGAALEGGAKGIFINVFNAFQTGSFFKTGSCPGPGQGEKVGTLSKLELGVLSSFFPATKQLAARGFPTYPKGKQCNVRGLTGLGRYAVRKMMAAHMLIEVDHLSERARDTVLEIAARSHYPLVSSHNGTGGEWTAAELRKLRAIGGYASVTPDTSSALAAKIEAMARFGFFGVGLGTDTGGFASLPGPRPDAATNPLSYPFRSYDRKVTFVREQTGTRVFDLNTDGVAHYGLIADLVADMQQTGRRRALPPLFRSAEAYLRTWQRAIRHG